MKHFTLARFTKTSLPLAVWLETPGKHNFHEFPHTHDCHEIMFLQEGTGWCGINGKHYPMLRGSMFLIKPGDIHEFSTNKGIRFFNIMFDESLFTEEENVFFNTILKESGKFNVSQVLTDSLSENFLELSQELSRKANGVTIAAHALFLRAMVLAVRNADRVTDEVRIKHESQTARLLFLLSKAYERKLSLDALAKEMHISAGYAGRLVHKLTGVSFSEYVRNSRMEQAQHLLENTDKPISEIAFSLGYFDSPHFDKQFRSAIGCSPLEFRKTILNGKNSR